MKDLAARFAEVEQRVRALVAERESLRERIRELEADLDRVRQEAQDAHRLRASRAQVQERLTRLLRALEQAEARETAREAERT